MRIAIIIQMHERNAGRIDHIGFVAGGIVFLGGHQAQRVRERGETVSGVKTIRANMAESIGERDGISIGPNCN